MGRNIIYEYPDVHDNVISSYEVDIKNKTLTLHTNYYEQEHTDINFTGVLSHRFEDVIQNNIISGIYNTSIESFFDEYKEQILEWIRYGFPASVNDIVELAKKLNQENYKVIELDSAQGLNGFVIAKDIEIIIINKIIKELK